MKNFLFLLIIFLFTGCFSTRHLEKGDELLVKNKIIVNDKKNAGVEGQDESFENFIKQKPNRKIVGVFRFHLWLYNAVSEKRMQKQIIRKQQKLTNKNAKIEANNLLRAEKGKPLKELKKYKPAWREKWRTIVGEPPVLLDTNKTKITTKQLRSYLFKKGYLDAEVDYSISSKFLSKKKVKAIYYINTGKPYIINQFIENIHDTIINTVINDLRLKGEISTYYNQRLDIDKLDKERDIISSKLNNIGFYEFNKEYLSYQIDTNQQGRTAKLKLILNNPKRRDILEDSVKTLQHIIYSITKAKVIISSSKGESEVVFKTTKNNIEFQYNTLTKILSEDEILRNILFNLNSPYNYDLVTQTRKRLASMGLFEYVQIVFSKEDEESSERYQNLHCEIRLKLLRKQTLQAETKGTYTNGNYGVEGGLSYINRNLFKGGEKLKLSVSGGFQTQQSFTNIDNSSTKVTDLVDLKETFNTFEIGPKLEYSLPRLLFFNSAFNNVDFTQTHLTTNLTWQRTPDYKRVSQDYIFGYVWSIGKSNFSLDPAEISFVDIQITNAEFQESIFSRKDLFLANSFIDHVIVGSRFRYKYFTSTKRSKFYLDSFLEGVGNTLKTFYQIFGVPTNTNGNHEFFGIQFAQFFKIQTELRYHYNLSKSNDLAFRVNGGLGVPFKNSNYALPFEKAFFVGGPNSLRGWKARTLGPGAYSTTEKTFDKIGDIILEGNAEYRFEMTSTLEGAFFIDAGNIWLYDPNSTRVGGSFSSKTFLGEIALDSGFGLRFDFDYFLLRFDFAVPFKTPYLPIGERWIFQNKTVGEGNFAPQLSFGIGYPF